MSAYCIAVFQDGCQPHEVICTHPSLLCSAGDTHAAVRWDDIEDSLRGALTKVQAMHHSLPPAREGALVVAAHQSSAERQIVTVRSTSDLS